MGTRLLRLDEVADVRLGRQRSPKNHSGRQMRPYLRAANVKWSGLLLDDVKSMNFTEAEMQTYRLQIGDLLLGEASGSATEVGKPAVWNGEIEDCAFQNTLLRVRPKDVNPRYLLHFFRHEAHSGNFAARSRGVGIYHLGREALASWQVPLPSDADQQKIADILDRADVLRAKRRQTISRLDELAQSIFLTEFGDPDPKKTQSPVTTIGNMLAAANYGTPHKAGSAGDYPILRMGNITNDGRIDLADLKYIDLAPKDEPRYLVSQGDVLFNRTNSADRVGKTAVYRNANIVAYAGYLIRLRLNDENDAEYLAAFLNSKYGKCVLRGMAKSIVGMANINATELKSVAIGRPPLARQVAFGDRIRAIESTRSAYLASERALDGLFMSLQQRAFAGQL